MMKSRLPLVAALLFLCGVPASVYAQSQYSIYYGDFHSHTWYSDGSQDQNQATYTVPVARAITYARSSPSMNFLGVSDHNHTDGGLHMTLAHWRSGFHEADSVNQDGSFVGMYGQEWGVIGQTADSAGHLCIYGTDRLFGWNPGVYDVYVAKSDYKMLFDSVYRYGGFAYLAHPDAWNFEGIFVKPYNALWDSVVEGVAVRSGPATSTNVTETNPSSSDYSARYHDLLRLGYHVAPCEHQDNHNTTFGRVNQQRTAVLATSLTRANVVDALRNRRVYATDDHNLQLRFECGTHVMGEIFSTSGPFSFRIVATDPDGEHLSRIELRYGIPGSGLAPTALTTVTGQDSLIYTPSQALNTTYYYYVYVQQADGNSAWSAPMWITTVPAGSLPAAFSLSTPAANATSQPVSGTLRWQSSTGATSYDVYLGTQNPPTTLVSGSQTDTTFHYSGLANSATYYWNVNAKNSAGAVASSNGPRSFTTVIASPGSFALSSPSNGASNQPLSGTLSWQASANATQYDVYLDTQNPPALRVSAGQAGTTYPYSGLARGTVYFWKIVAKNAVDSATSTGAPWSFTTIPQPPATFNLSLPVNGVGSQPLTGTLSWQASGGASQYDVYFDTVTPPARIVSSNQAGTSYGYSALLNNRTYYWSAVAKNPGGSTTAADAPYSFTTIVAAPSSFSLLTPTTGSLSQPLTDTLTWTAASGANVYDVYVDTVSPPGQLRSADQAGTSYVVTGLQNNAKYYWSVTAKNAGGNTASTTFNFTTVVAPPAAFGLQAPLDGAAGVITSDTLRWSPSAGATGYDVYLDTLTPPTVRVGSNVAPTWFRYTDLQNARPYYWMVVAKNAGGSTSSGSPWSFTTTSLPYPHTFQLLSPSPGASGQGTSVTLTWGSSQFATAYDVYCDTVDPPAVKISSDQADTSVPVTGLLLNRTYHWDVVAKSASGSMGSLNGPFSFQTILLPKPFALLTPADGQSGAALNENLTWENSTNATAYDVYVDTVSPPLKLAASGLATNVYACAGLQTSRTYYWSVTARNTNGQITALSAPRSFATGNFPPAPDSGSAVALASTILRITWNDIAQNESGYHVLRGESVNGSFVQIGPDLPPNANSFSDSGLAINHHYYYRIVPFNAVGDGGTLALDAATRAEVPSVSLIGSPGYQSARFAIGQEGNPPTTFYSVTLMRDTARWYVQPDGSISTTPTWADLSTWGDSAGLMLTGLHACSAYTISAAAENEDGVVTSQSPPLDINLPCYSVTHHPLAGWNLFSLPMKMGPVAVASLLPGAISRGFSYDGGYQPHDSLTYGRGYWVKMAADTSVILSGDPTTSDTLSLVSGWNLIGTVSVPMATGAIVQVPASLTSSQYFGFDGAYSVVDTLRPFHAYWVRASAGGKLVLTSAVVLQKTEARQEASVGPADTVAVLTFTDHAGHRQTLRLIAGSDPSAASDLPPVPPEGAFDVRFDDQRMERVLTQNGTGDQISRIRLQSPSLPVTVEWKSASDSKWMLRMNAGNKQVGLAGSGKAILSVPPAELLVTASPVHGGGRPKEFALHQNYPDPFNPSTTIAFDLPVEASVTLNVFNLLGQQVASVLEHEQMAGGSHQLQFDAGRLASGVYCYRIQFEARDNSNRPVEKAFTRKMVLMK